MKLKLKNFSKKKKALLIIGCIVMVLIIFQIFGSMKKTSGYTLATVERADITEVVTETGVLAHSNTTAVYSPSTGVIKDIWVKNGDRVVKNQKLLTIESTATDQEKQQALTTYLAAKSSLDAAQTNQLRLQAQMFSSWDRYKNLAENDTYETSDGKARVDNRQLPEFVISEKTWLAAEQEYKKQQNVIAQAQAAVGSTYLLYQTTQNATVLATSNGVIANLTVDQNHSITASATNPILYITEQTQTQAQVALSENDVAKIQVNQPATIEVKPIIGTTYHGTVKRIDTIGIKVNGVVRYNAYVDITDPDERIRSGMNADVTIVTNQKTNVLSVPNAAIKPYQGGRAVRLPDGNNPPKFQPVTIGIRDKEHTEIVSGVEEQQSIIVSLANEQIKRSGLLGM